MEKFLKGATEVANTQSETIRLEYFLTKEPSGESATETAFGIAVLKTEEGLTEYEATGGISYDGKVVEELLNILMDNTVTPFALLETVDDLITEKLCS